MIKKLKIKKEAVIFVLILFLGFIFRLYFSSLAFKELIWDMQSYTNLAREIYLGQWIMDCCSKNAGYSLFIAWIYHLFGFENLNVVRVANIIFDLLTAVFIFKIVLGKTNKTGAWVAFLLYVFNPITSSYTGLILSENITLFFVSATALLITKKGFLNHPLWWFSFGFLLGILVLLRYSLLSFSMLIILLFTIFVIKKRSLVFFTLASLGFFLASLYSIRGNFKHFHVLSLTPPYNPGMIAFYMSFYQTSRYPELVSQYPEMNKTYYQINLEYYTTYYTWIPQLKDKYAKLFWQKIRKDWPVFIQNTVRNIFFIWDKNHLFAYADPFYPKDRWFIRIYNLILLSFAGIAMVNTVMKKRIRTLKDPFVLFTLLLLGYITGAITLVSNESRHSLFFYAVLFVWVGYGAGRIGKRLHLVSCA